MLDVEGLAAGRALPVVEDATLVVHAGGGAPLGLVGRPTPAPTNGVPGRPPVTLAKATCLDMVGVALLPMATTRVGVAGPPSQVARRPHIAVALVVFQGGRVDTFGGTPLLGLGEEVDAPR